MELERHSLPEGEREELVRQTLAGNSEALYSLIEFTVARNKRTLEGILRSRPYQSVRDVSQSAWLRASAGIDGIRGRSVGEVLGWIHRTVVNAALNLARGKGEDRRVDEPISGLASPCQGVSSALAEKEQAVLITQAIDRLDDRSRSVVLLSYHQKMCDREIAEILGESFENVRQIRHRARSKLKKLLGL
jgi:RNA polymerase sigma-70 factor, ECF subfamily